MIRPIAELHLWILPGKHIHNNQGLNNLKKVKDRVKYQIDTIPVWDAYHQDEECPLCILEYKSEMDYVDFFLSGSVMEPDTRIEVNRVGFCAHHFQLLYNEKNRLGLGLITHTHLKETIDELESIIEGFDSIKDEGVLAKLGSLLPKSIVKPNDTLKELLDWLHNHHNSCIICNRIDDLLNRYAYTILHLWQDDENFQSTIAGSKGFCLHHLALMMRVAYETLSDKVFDRWSSFILPLEVEVLKELEGDLSWFTKKFDYRNKDKPWGNSRDALPRTLLKLSGSYMEPPPFNEEIAKK